MVSFLKSATTAKSIESDAKEREKEKEYSRIGEILQRKGVLSPRDIEIIVTEQKAISGGKFGEVALKLGLLTEKQITEVLAEQAGIDVYDLYSGEIDYAVAQLISSEESREHGMLPLKRTTAGKIIVGITEPGNNTVKDVARRVLGSAVTFVAVDRSDLYLTQSRIYSDLNFQNQAESLAYEIINEVPDDKKPAPKVLVPKLVSAIVWDALANRASDIHMICTGEVFRVQYRIAGVLKYKYGFPVELFSRVAAQIKGFASMEQGDKLHTGDGTWDFNAGNRIVSLRISKMPINPAPDGESLVARVLDQSRVALDLNKLGFYPEDVELLTAVAQDPFGMALCTGPTGSGKTTTLYSLLGTLKAFDTNIMTIENPVEYKIPGVRQVQVNEKANITFSSALRTFLRQDPDVILVGEIRDSETAKISVQSAITGHLVFSTLHTNDAPSAVTRLMSYGADPTAVQSSLTCVIAQRLVRKVCPHCSIERQLTPREIQKFERNNVPVPATVRDVDPEKYQDCHTCHDGFTIPTIIYEIMKVDAEIRKFLRPETEVQTLKDLALSKGMTTMLQNGLRKVADGITTMSEIQRVSRED